MGSCIARLKTSVWKRQSFKITARPRVICERSLDVPIAAAFCKLFTIGLKCSARSFAPTESVAWKEQLGRKVPPDSRDATPRENNFYIKAAAVIGERVIEKNLSYLSSSWWYPLLYLIRMFRSFHVSVINSVIIHWFFSFLFSRNFSYGAFYKLIFSWFFLIFSLLIFIN